MTVAAAKANEWHRKQIAAAGKDNKSIMRSEKSRWIMRAKLARKTVTEFKQRVPPLAVRRQIARERTAARKSVAQSSQHATDALLLLHEGMR